MDTFGIQGLNAVEAVRVEIYTVAHRIEGTVHTPFRRVADMLNQLPVGHLAIEDATIVDYAHPDRPLAEMPATTVHVAVGEVLVVVAPDLGGTARAEMRIRKQQAPAMLVVPPLSLTGTIHVPVDSRPVENVLNVADRFVPMTAVTLSSERFPGLDRQVSVLAVRRDRAHVIVVGEELESGAVEARDRSPH